MAGYKPESSPSIGSSKYRAYDPDGNFREIVVLNNESKRRYEAKGWTFKRANYSG